MCGEGLVVSLSHVVSHGGSSWVQELSNSCVGIIIGVGVAVGVLLWVGRVVLVIDQSPYLIKTT